MSKKVINIGIRFGSLVVVAPAETIAYRSTSLCLCDCGVESVKRNNNLLSGAARHCSHACVVTERHTTHGQCVGGRSKEHNTWHSMKQRCNPETDKRGYYGKSGVTICDRWKHSFESFLEDMWLAPSDKHAIDRIDNSKGYEPGNCRWATQKQQTRNKTNNKRIEFYGIRLCLSQWLEISGTTRSAYYWRLKRGWAIRDAIWTPRIVTA